MASTYTTNYNLEKPDPNADININPINGDMDSLDSIINTLQTDVNTKTNRKTIQGAVLQQLNSSGSKDTNGITSFPTTPGVYRVTSYVTGLPSGAGGYGTLVIMNGGGYPLYIYVDYHNDFYYSRVATETAPSTWYKLQGTSVAAST